MDNFTIEDVTTVAIDGTGIFDKLMASVKLHVQEEYSEGRLKGAEYATVYLGSIQAVLAHSVEFALQKEQVASQISKTEADKANASALAQAELIKQHGFDVSIVDGVLVLGDSTGSGVIDKQILDTIKTTDVRERQMIETEATGDKQRTLLTTEEETKRYEVDNILPEKLIQLQEQTDLIQSQDLEVIKSIDVKERTTVIDESKAVKQLVLLDEDKETADKQQLLLDKELLIKGYEHNTLQVDQHNTNVKQQALLDTEEEAKQYEVDDILPKQVDKLIKGNKLLQTQNSELLLNGVKQRLSIDADISLKETQNQIEDYKINSILPKELSSLEEDVKTKYTIRVGKDKEVAELGLDKVVRSQNNSPETVYTPKYEE